MKLAVASLVLASPIRLISLSELPPSFAPSPPEPPRVEYASPPIWPFAQPCSKHRSSPPRNTLASILGMFGIAPPPPRPHVFDFDLSSPTSAHAEELLRDARERMEEMESSGVPILESGVVRILPFEEGRVEKMREDDRREWRMRGWRQKHHHHHHEHDEERGRGRGRMYWRHHHSFGARIAHALRHLSTPEVFALIFVLGVGIGSLLHVAVVLFIIFLRMSRYGGFQACRERRQRRLARKAAKAERKAAKKAAKLAKKQGQEGLIRLEGEDGEQPPRYEDHPEVTVEEKV